jgi:hypothetical protein
MRRHWCPDPRRAAWVGVGCWTGATANPEPLGLLHRAALQRPWSCGTLIVVVQVAVLPATSLPW